MQNLVTKCLLFAGAVAIGIGMTAPEKVEARPGYLKSFKKAYADVAKANKVTCAACHPSKLADGKATKSKKIRNNYGAAFGKALMGKDIGGKKNEKDADKIKKAIKAAEKAKSATDGKTFGDLLKAKKLPGTNAPAKKEKKKE